MDLPVGHPERRRQAGDAWSRLPLGYHINGNVVTATGLTEAAVAAPSNCTADARVRRGHRVAAAYLRPYAGGGATRSSAGNGPEGKNGPHMDGYNFLLADTHAKWFSDTQSLNLSQFAEDTGRSTKALHPKANPACPAS